MREPLALPPLLRDLLPIVSALEMPVYLVGGAVRDLLLGRPVNDLDFTVAGSGVRAALRVGDALGRPAYALDAARDVGRVVLAADDTYLDFASFRPPADGSTPTLEGDLRDRDFTVNALALPLAGSPQALTADAIIDPTGGLADLAARQLRLTHAGALAADPVRALRAVRQSHALGFALAAATLAALPAAAPLLRHVSVERVRDEFCKLLLGAAPAAALADLHAGGLLGAVLPELLPTIGVTQSPPHREDVFDHTLSVVRRLALIEAAIDGDPADRSLAPLAEWRTELRDWLATRFDGGVDGRLLLRLAAVLHDTGKPQTRSHGGDGRIHFYGHELVSAALTEQRLTGLHFSRAATDFTAAIVQHHMRPLQLAQPGGVSRRAVYRYFKATGATGVGVALHALADHSAKYDGPGPTGEWQPLIALAGSLFDGYFARRAEAVNPPRLIGGQDVMQLLGIAPGRRIGEVLAAVEEAQAVGEITDREAALAFVRRFASGSAAADRGQAQETS